MNLRDTVPSPVNATAVASLKSSLDTSPRSYFGGSSLLYESPSSSPGDSGESDPEEPEYYRDNDEDDDDDDSASVSTDSTLEDLDGQLDFGHPLERMPRMSSADHGLEYEMSENVKALLHVAISGSAYSSRSHSPSSMASSAASPTFDSASYERVVDYLIELKPDPFGSAGHRNLVMFDPPLHFDPDSVPSIMVKRLHRTSAELILLLEINHPESREDPWNAAPRILHAVERDDFVFLCMQRFSAYNKPPLVTVAHHIDFFRQVLEGLSFLHEERIVGLNCAEPSSYMVDLSSAPRVPAATKSTTTNGTTPLNLKGIIEPQHDLPPIQFDRFKYPVRYYFANFTDATRVHHEAKSNGSSPSSGREAQTQNSRPECPYKRDVKDTGEMFNRLLEDVPQIATKFRALTKAMINGGFSADDSRRLFDALCRSVDSKVFDSAALTHLPTPEEKVEKAPSSIRK